MGIRVSNDKNFMNGTYHVKISGYFHANDTYLKVYGADGSRIWVIDGIVYFKYGEFNDVHVICGTSYCNTLVVDVEDDYLELISRRAREIITQDMKIDGKIEGYNIQGAAADDSTCAADSSCYGCTTRQCRFWPCNEHCNKC